jgi:hypothetical protein
VARKQKNVDDRLAVRYLDDDILLTATQAWTYVRLPLLSYEFQSYAAREGFCEQITLALATLVNNNNTPVEAHLRVTHRPLDTLNWAGRLHNRVAGQGPTDGWQGYLSNMAGHVDEQNFDVKEVYLGVALGDRRPTTTRADLLDPVKLLTSAMERVTGLDDDVVQPAELKDWRRKAQDVHRALGQSHLRALPANAEEVARLIAQPLWPSMTQPPVTASPREVWGPGEMRQLVEGHISHQRRWLEVEQLTPSGTVETGFSVTLAISRFPDVLNFPDQEPWIHYAAAFPFPVEFSTRMSIVPAMQVQKDVGKKLADAKDQAIHIAESGTAVPIKVREQLEVATVLEYTIDKDRIPWAYSRHRLTVTGRTAEEVTARARTVMEAYRELGMDVSWPTGDQFDLMRESMPGEPTRSRSYYQRQELAVIGGGMPTASSECGDRQAGESGWRGPYLGYTTSRVVTPVFFSPHVAMARNYPPGVAITGAPGGGKSFLAFTLAHQMAVQGVWTIYIDPKADAKPMGQLTGLGSPRVFDLRDGNDGMLDPFSLGETRAEATLLALETLRLLLGGQVSEEREEALINAVDAVANQPEPSLSKVVEVLLSNTESSGARNLGSVLKTLRDLPFARLCFAPTAGARLRPEDGLTIVTLLGLDLPSAASKPDDYSYENRLAVSVMYLLTRYARRLMLNMDKSHPKAICIDEAWAITSTPQGAKLIPEIARMGRSHNTALVLVSQNAGDLMAESVTNSISTKFAFRSTIPGEINDVLDLMGLEGDQGFQSSVRDLRNGECLMQDVDGRVARVQVDAWNRELFEVFNTNPETRGKTAGSKTEEGR